jgi:hypothetical protein
MSALRFADPGARGRIPDAHGMKLKSATSKRKNLIGDTYA